VPIEDQPAGLIQNPVHEMNHFYSCETCLPGYFEENGECVSCEIEDCIKCSSEEYCEECDDMNEEGELLMLTPDKAQCQAKVTSCDIPLEE